MKPKDEEDRDDQAYKEWKKRDKERRLQDMKSKAEKRFWALLKTAQSKLTHFI